MKKRKTDLFRFIILLFLSVVILTSCTGNIKKKNDSSISDKTSNEINGDWKFHENQIGEKINDKLLQLALINTLGDALERDFIRPFDDFLLFDEIKSKIQFFEYQKVRFGETLFDAYYTEIDLKEDHDKLKLVFIVNPDENAVNNSLVIFEHYKNEAEIIRKAVFDYPYIETFGISGVDTLNYQTYVLSGNNFLDYFKINGKHNQQFSQDGFNYQSTGTIKNHLKSDKWQEQSFTSKYSETVCQKTIKGTYRNGLKNGFWVESYELENTSEEIISSGNYQNGKKRGEWKTFFRDTCISSMYFNENMSAAFTDLLESSNKSSKVADIKKMGGVYSLRVFWLNDDASHLIEATLKLSINGEYAFLDSDSDYPLAPGEYNIEALTKNSILCTKAIDDYGARAYFQINCFEGKFYIKGNIFFIDEWMPIEQTHSL